jgi:hypothetical protein
MKPHECKFSVPSNQRSLHDYLVTEDLDYTTYDRIISHFIASSDLPLESGTSDELFTLLYEAFSLGTEFQGPDTLTEKIFF